MTSVTPALFSAAAPLSAAINHLLAQEPWARQELLRHAGKVACLDGGTVALRLRVTADGMLEPAPAEETARVTIRFKLADLPLIAQNRERAFSYVQIEGDAEFANALANLGKSLRWEAEVDLEKLFGPVAAVRMVSGARSLFEAVQNGQRKLAENVAEFLLEEKPVLIRPQAVAGFSADVVRLRDDVERAAKRLAKLEKALEQKLQQKLGTQ
jgi:ubiquinone biosynthesis protein UbiJ